MYSLATRLEAAGGGLDPGVAGQVGADGQLAGHGAQVEQRRRALEGRRRPLAADRAVRGVSSV